MILTAQYGTDKVSLYTQRCHLDQPVDVMGDPLVVVDIVLEDILRSH
jgi:hypothetical protein